jgi:N-acetyl-anhydromuramyl-L-alanine amidase AmpD
VTDISGGYLPMTASATDYKIDWKGSPNFWSGRDGNSPLAICDHIMQGAMESTNGWFKNLRSDVSSHFGVAADGRIWQWVKVEDTAWANGVFQNPDTSVDWIANCVRNNINPNNVTISIEHEGYTGKTLPESQYQATLWLHRYLCKNYNIPVDRKHLIGHNQIDKVSRASCPGTAFPWDRLLKDLSNNTVVVQPPAPTPPPVAVVTPPAPKPEPIPVITPAPTPTPVTTPDPAPADAAPVTIEPERTPPPVSNPWLEGVDGVVFTDAWTAPISSSNAFVRTRPSTSLTDGSFLRALSRGTILHFVGYTDAGPNVSDSTRWNLISEEDGGGWIHSKMVGKSLS